MTTFTHVLKNGGQLKDPLGTKWLYWHGLNRCWYVATREHKKRQDTVLGRFDDNETGIENAVKLLMNQ